MKKKKSNDPLKKDVFIFDLQCCKVRTVIIDCYYSRIVTEGFYYSEALIKARMRFKKNHLACRNVEPDKITVIQWDADKPEEIITNQLNLFEIDKDKTKARLY